MTKHHGEHPRMGATDVFPFVPIQGVTMDDCVDMARRLGRGWARTRDSRCTCTGRPRPTGRRAGSVRKGEYEACPRS